jgi:hypothetical protein
MSKLSVLGIGAAGGTVGVLVLGMLIFIQLGRSDFAFLLGAGLLIFIVGGALAIAGRAGLLRG